MPSQLPRQGKRTHRHEVAGQTELIRPIDRKIVDSGGENRVRSLGRGQRQLARGMGGRVVRAKLLRALLRDPKRVVESQGTALLGKTSAAKQRGDDRNEQSTKDNADESHDLPSRTVLEHT